MASGDFKVMLGGGLGAQPFSAQTAFEFLEEDRVIPFIEGVIRVFDRYGERQKRHKARMKYLLNDIGLDELMRRIADETPALGVHSYVVDDTSGNPLFAAPPASPFRMRPGTSPLRDMKPTTAG